MRSDRSRPLRGEGLALPRWVRPRMMGAKRIMLLATNSRTLGGADRPELTTPAPFSVRGRSTARISERGKSAPRALDATARLRQRSGRYRRTVRVGDFDGEKPVLLKPSDGVHVALHGLFEHADRQSVSEFVPVGVSARFLEEPVYDNVRCGPRPRCACERTGRASLAVSLASTWNATSAISHAPSPVANNKPPITAAACQSPCRTPAPSTMARARITHSAATVSPV